MDKLTEIKVERYVEELKDLAVDAKLLLIKMLCATLESSVARDDIEVIEGQDREKRRGT